MPVKPSASPTTPPPRPGPDAGVRLADALARADIASGVSPGDGCTAAREARRLAGELGRDIDRGRASVWLCSHLLRLGRHAEVLAEAPAALALLAPPELAAERRGLLRLVALAGSETGAHDVALDAAHELVRLTAELDDDGASLYAAYGLAVCFERMGDSWHATRLLAQAIDAHGAGAADMNRMIVINALCAISIGVMHRLRDAEPEAEVQAVLARARQAGEEARALLERVGDPTYEVTILGNLGEVLLHQGELVAAEPLLRRSHELAVQRGLQSHAWRVQVTLCSWELASGRPEEALRGALAVIDKAGDALTQQSLIRVHHVAYRACRALARFEEALRHFEVVERTERRRATAQLRAQSELFVTRTETQQALWQAEQSHLEAQTQRQRAAEFAESAERDPLTGLGNRRHLARRSAELLPAAQRDQSPLALALIDIDHFKPINDRHGHAVGDAVLVALAQLLRENTRVGDVLARHGGEEFVVMLPGMSQALAAEVCERLRERVAAYPWSGAAGATGLETVTISIGLSATPGYDAAGLISRADAALYRAKRTGRNRLELA